MVARFALLAPWWARYLIDVAATTASLAVAAAALFPGFRTAAAWPWNAVAVVAVGVFLAVGPLIMQQPMRRAYAAALAGLDRRQRILALTALRRNNIPSNPAVLAAAIRAAALHMVYLKGLTKSQRAVRWWLPSIYVVMAVLQFLDHQLLKGLLWLGFGLYFGGIFAAVAYRAKWLPPRVAHLRAAAAAVPEAETALSETAGGVPRPPRRLWVLWVVVVALGACFVPAEHFWGSHSHRATSQHDRCATVDKAFKFVNEHPDMLRSERLPTGDPTLSAYQDWSDHLHTFAQQERDPDLAHRLDTVDSLATHAVAVVRDLRAHAGPGAPADVISAHEIDYRTTVSAIVDQLGAATSDCKPRR